MASGMTIVQHVRPQLNLVFYVHLSDVLNYVLVNPKLDESNYVSWSKSMCPTLGDKNKLSILMDQCLSQTVMISIVQHEKGVVI